jgi:hypothetical protein
MDRWLQQDIQILRENSPRRPHKDSLRHAISQWEETNKENYKQPKVMFDQTDGVPTSTVTDSVPVSTITGTVPASTATVNTDSILAPKGGDIRPSLGAFPHECRSYASVIQWKESSVPQYNAHATRLQTYSRWPRVNPTPEQMSAAGFYFTGKILKTVTAKDKLTSKLFPPTYIYI